MLFFQNNTFDYLSFIDSIVTLNIFILIIGLINFFLIFKVYHVEIKLTKIPIISSFYVLMYSIVFIGSSILINYTNINNENDCKFYSFTKYSNNICSYDIYHKIYNFNQEEIIKFKFSNNNIEIKKFDVSDLKKYDTNDSNELIEKREKPIYIDLISKLYLAKNISFDDEYSEDDKNNLYHYTSIPSIISIKHINIFILITFASSLFFLVILKKIKEKKFINKKNSDNHLLFLNFTFFFFILNQLLKFELDLNYSYSYVLDYFYFSLLINSGLKKPLSNTFILNFLITFILVIYFGLKFYFIFYILILFFNFFRQKLSIKIIISIIILFIFGLIFLLNFAKLNLGGHYSNNVYKYINSSQDIIFYHPNYGNLIFELKNNQILSIKSPDDFKTCSVIKPLVPQNTKFIKEIVKKCNYKNLKLNDEEKLIFATSINEHNAFIKFIKNYQIVLFGERLLGPAPRLVFSNLDSALNKQKYEIDKLSEYKKNYLKNLIKSAIPLIDKKDFYIAYTQYLRNWGLFTGYEPSFVAKSKLEINKNNNTHSEQVFPVLDFFIFFHDAGSIVFAFIFVLICFFIYSSRTFKNDIFKSYLLVVIIMSFEENSVIFFSGIIKYLIFFTAISYSFRILKNCFQKYLFT